MMTVKYAFKQSVPIMAGYIVLGMGFGVLLESKGYGVLWAIAMSVFIYAGSMQYVAINLITGGASLIATALMTLMVNARHLFYGISMLEKYKGLGWKKFFLIFGMCDETFSINYTAAIPEHVDRGWFLFFVTLLNYVYWVSGATIGGLAGDMSVLLWSGFLYDSGYGCHRRASHPVEKETIAIGGLKSNDTFAANDHHRPVRRRNDVDTFSPVPHIS